MNNLQLGKMYLVKEFFWFLFPTKKLAAVCGECPDGPTWAMTLYGPEVARRGAKVLSEHYNCNVSFVEPKTCFVLLEMDETEHCYKLLDSNGNIGWTRCWSFASYFELVKE